MKVVSLVSPVFNEEAVIEHFLVSVKTVMQDLPLGLDYELVLVDDGSTDRTHALLSTAAAGDGRIRVVTFSRNFGHQAAIAAGLEAAKGDAIVTLDCDLQDPPEVILRFITHWIDGADLVLGRRTDRSSDTWVKRSLAKLFYKAIAKISSSPLESDVADFRLMSRSVVDVLKQLNESSPYWRGLVQWVGFDPVYVDYSRESRVAGSTKYSFKKMFRLALSGITSFSDRPLIGVSLVGLLITCLSGLYSMWVLISKIVWPERSVPGYITAILLTLFLSGVQLLVLGLIGIYVSSVNRNVRRRPEFVIWWDRCKNLEFCGSNPQINSQIDAPRSLSRIVND
jgi:dolichol-phosphate mannosyltransferase